MLVEYHVIRIRGKPFLTHSSLNKYKVSLCVRALVGIMNNPKCYFDVSCDEENIGRIVFEMRADLVPKTVENFKKLCEGLDGKSYKNNVFHRIIPGFMCQVRICVHVTGLSCDNQDHFYDHTHHSRVPTTPITAGFQPHPSQQGFDHTHHSRLVLSSSSSHTPLVTSPTTQ